MSSVPKNRLSTSAAAPPSTLCAGVVVRYRIGRLERRPGRIRRRIPVAVGVGRPDRRDRPPEQDVVLRPPRCDIAVGHRHVEQPEQPSALPLRRGHGCRQRPRAMRFHISGELSSQNRPAWVWSGVRSLGVVTPSPPSALHFFEIERVRVTGHGVRCGGPELVRLLQHERPDVAPPRCESERRIIGEAPLARRGALREIEVLERRIGTVTDAARQDGGCRRLAQRDPRRPGGTWGNQAQRRRVVGFGAGDAGVATRLWERRGNLRDRRDQDVTRRGGDRGVR